LCCCGVSIGCFSSSIPKEIDGKTIFRVDIKGGNNGIVLGALVCHSTRLPDVIHKSRKELVENEKIEKSRMMQ